MIKYDSCLDDSCRSAMLNRLFEFVFYMSEGSCGRWSCIRWRNNNSSNGQGDTHGDGWNDSSLVDQVPIVKLYPVPKMVHFVNYHGDEVSTLYEGSIQSLRNNNTDNDPSCLACGEEKIPDDSELRVDSCLPYEDE